MAESVCHCEIHDVTHSDDFTCNQNIFTRFVRQKRKNCKEVKSHSVNLRKSTNTDQYFLQFKKDTKVHDHELPLIGTCLMISEAETKNKETTMIKFYQISRLGSEILQPILSLSVKNDDCENLERCLRTNLKVNYYIVYDVVYQQSAALIKQCVLHITPHYLCMANKTDKNNLAIYCIYPICSGTTILYGNENVTNNSSDDLTLKITSHNPENTVELKFRTGQKDDVLEKLQTYMKDICTINDDNDNTFKNHDNASLPDNDKENAYEQIPLPVSAPVPPTKVISPSTDIFDPMESSQKSKPPSIKRDKKPSTPVVEHQVKRGAQIQYENSPTEFNKGYQNIDIKNKKALKLSVSVFASEPILSDPWLLEIIFIRSEDFEGTFKSVENSQKSCGRHLIVPCRPIQAVTGMVVVLDIKSPGFQLMSGEQHISYDKLVGITSVSWLVVEEVITYNGNTDSDVHFWSTLKLVSEPDSVNVEISVLDKFKGLKKERPRSTNLPAPITFPLTYASRIQFCQLLDMNDVFGKDWKYFADSMGLKPHEIRVIESKGSSYTESVLRHLEVHLPSRCKYNYVIGVLEEMGRGDIIELLITCNESGVEDTEETFSPCGNNPKEN